MLATAVLCFLVAGPMHSHKCDILAMDSGISGKEAKYVFYVAYLSNTHTHTPENVFFEVEAITESKKGYL